MLQRSLFVLSTIIILLNACSKTAEETTLTGGTTSTATTTSIDSAFTAGTAEGSTETGVNAEDLVESSSFITISFGSTINISNPLASSGVTITQSGGDELKSATTYNVYTGGAMSSEATSFKGLYTSGAYTKGTKTSTSFTTTNRVTQTGGSISRG